MNISYINFLNDLDELKLLLEHVNNLAKTPQYLKIRSTTSKSIIVVSSGLLERFLKESFIEFIESINEINVPKENINDKIWHTNKKNTLVALKFISENKLDSNYSEVVNNYASAFGKIEKLKKPVLVKEAFSITRSNPGDKTIKKLFDDIGINLFCSRFFSDVGIVQMKLNSFINLRHSFAHGDPGITIPSLNEVQDYLIFLQNFVFNLNKVLNDEINNIETKHYPNCFKYLDDFHKGIILNQFKDDDMGFLKWIKTNPRGFILNCARKRSPKYSILHRANCHTINKTEKGKSRTQNCIKICSLNIKELETMAKQQFGGEPKKCQICMP